MSNQVFNLQRFILYAKAHLQENKRKYFWFFAVISMIYFMILLMVISDGKFRTTEQMGLYYMGLIVTGSVFAVRYFASLAHLGSSLVTLMQPVSTFEKWLLAVLIVLIGYPLIYTLIFEVMTYPIALISKQNALILAQKNQVEPNLLKHQLFIPLTAINMDSSYTNIRIIEQIPFFCAYIGITGYAVTSSIWFKRLPLIKSVAVGFILLLSVLFFMTVLLSNTHNDLIPLAFWFDKGNYQATNIAWFASALLWLIAPVSIWIASFFALQERDIA